MKSPKLQETKSTISFSAKLSRSEAKEETGSWTLTLPKKASAKLPSRGRTAVEGTINAFPFRADLEPDGKGSHLLMVNETMRDSSGADAVDTVTVEITRAGEEPEIRVPMDLRKALAAAPLAQVGWEDITPMARRDWIFSIISAKQPETRRRRIEKACDMLASVKRRLCCFPGIKWLMKENAKSCGMWLPLPNSQDRLSAKSTTWKTAKVLRRSRLEPRRNRSAFKLRLYQEPGAVVIGMALARDDCFAGGRDFSPDEKNRPIGGFNPSVSSRHTIKRSEGSAFSPS